MLSSYSSRPAATEESIYNVGKEKEENKEEEKKQEEEQKEKELTFTDMLDQLNVKHQLVA